jgi:hypothetical protein
MNRELIENIARELAAAMPSLPAADWPLIIIQAVGVRAEVEKLEQLPLSSVEPIFSDLSRE